MSDEPVVSISPDSTFTEGPAVPEPGAAVEAARADLAAATTFAQVRDRTVALLDLLTT